MNPRSLLSLAIAGTVASLALGLAPAHAGNNRAFIGGLVGGVVAGAVVGSVIAAASQPPVYYYGGPAYAPPPVYPAYAPRPYYRPCPPGYLCR